MPARFTRPSFRLLGALYGFGVLLVTGAAAQPGPLPGVVWETPADDVLAEADLRSMHAMGVRAVRTGILHSESLLALADTLGVHVFQELPLDDLAAEPLRDTLDYARRLIELALAQSRNHPSARHFGLARRSDTSDPRACAFFETLAEQVHRSPSSRVYYLSAFIEADRCAGAVDFVLLDARDAPDPDGLLARWRAVHGASSGVGIGALGTWVRGDAASGLRVAHTPEYQARYLETHLGTLLTETARPAPSAVFVYRWRDTRTPWPSPAHDLKHPYDRPYGLYTENGSPRPARAVTDGFFTGRQTTFAFPPGDAPTPPVPWTLLFGWLVFALVGSCYALSPRFQYMVPRYFLAHGFYREGIREGREVLLVVSSVLLMALALSVGVLGSVALDALRATPAFQVLFRTLPETVQTVGVALLAQPWLLILLFSSFYALGVSLWTALLAFTSRRRYPLIPGQALMLVLWARWPFLLLLTGGLVVPSLPPALAAPAVLGLAGAWVLVMLHATLRTLVDYAAITGTPVYTVVFLGLINPAILLLLAGLLATLDLGPVVTLAWHLTIRF